MGITPGIWGDHVSCGQCLHQSSSIQGSAGRERIQAPEGGWNDPGDGEIERLPGVFAMWRGQRTAVAGSLKQPCS